MKARRKSASGEDQWRPNLPDEVLMEILCRLPIKTLISFKRVCKLWLNLISSDTDVHRKRAPPELLLQSSSNNGISWKLPFGNFQFHNHSVSDLKLSHLFNLANFSDIKMPNPVIVNSCNGFVCFRNNNILSNKEMHAVICNPVTGEFITVPGPQLDNTEASCLSYGLGFSGKENRYKLLRVDIQLRKSFAEICTFEKGSSWRNLGDCPLSYKNTLFWPLVYLEKKLHFHWCHRDIDRRRYNYIDCFDFDTEQFGKVPLPPLYDYDRVSYAITGKTNLIGELESSLSISCFGINSSVEVWVMKNYGVKDSWIKAFSLGTHDTGYIVRIPLMQLGNGDILLHSRDDRLVLYNPVLNQG